MKTQLAAATAALTLCLTSTALCQASIVNPADGFNTVKLYRGVGSRGGIFNVDKNPSGPVSLDFDTFCVQTQESMSFDTSYVVYNLSKKTMGSVQNNVSLSSFAAWLYSGFLGLDSDMNLASFKTTSAAVFSATNLTHVNALQAAIWRSMGYADSTFGYTVTATMNSMITKWNDAFTADTEWAAQAVDSNGKKTGNIKIMNLVTLNSNGSIKAHYQDQLVYIPPPPQGPPP
jgi:hypothetical protein